MAAAFKLSPLLIAELQEQLEFLYGSAVATAVYPKLVKSLVEFHQKNPRLQNADAQSRFTETDAVLITYGDQIELPGKPALRVLAETLAQHLVGCVNTVHILPFYPYSSDDGFSVIDYTAVNPALGNWDDLPPLRNHFRLMFDAVINHISAQSTWFQGFLQGDERYADYFITENPQTDLSSVTRPRTLPLLSPVETPSGTQYVWTTFSADQIDLNYKNPAVLLEIIDVLLFYIAQGAEFIRLDAIGYMWKEVGTTCIHLPQVHRAIQLMRTVLNAVAPNVVLITETNVPHAENISYFGNGFNEAQMVYNFSLPPLILHTMHTGNADALRGWAAGLTTPGNQTTYFNFIASHDGIGVMPAKGILTDAEIENLSEKTLAHGGLVSYRNNPDGSRSVYELNIALFDALSDPNSNESQSIQVQRFIASQAIMLALAGVPGVYVHSLFGSGNNHAGVKETGRARTINREKWQQSQLEATLADPCSIASQVFQRYKTLLKARTSHRAFHPNGKQDILETTPAIFALWRTAPNDSQRILCLHNASAKPQVFEWAPPVISTKDILTGKQVILGQHEIFLAPYQVKWLLVEP